MQNTMTRSVVGVFEDYSTAQSVRDALIARGFSHNEIEVEARENYASDAARGNTGLSGTVQDTSGGGIGGFFRRLFGNDDETYGARYSTAVDHGHAIVCVTTNDETRQELAADIMDSNGAIDVDERSSSWAGTGSSSLTGNQSTGSQTTGSQMTRGDMADRTIPVVREDPQVGKRMVQRGGVRIVNRVTEQPVQESVTLREEHVTVDRRAVDRPATERDFANRDEVIEVTEMAEEPVVGKRTRVVEEVSVGKNATERTETIRDTVRRTDVDVQQLGGSRYDDDFRSHFKTRYGTSGANYETYAPAYGYGYEMASDDRYKGRRWEDVETHLRTDYERRYPGSTWDRMKDSIRYGWERVTR
jgi:uncharacterized protein (TIGR02271 family)